MRQQLPIPAGLRLLRKTPFFVGLLLIIAGLWLLLLVYAMTGMENPGLDGWHLLRAATSGEGLLGNFLGLGLVVIGFLVAHIRPGDPPREWKSFSRLVQVKISATRLPRLRFTMRRMMLWVVIAAIGSLIVSEILEPFPPRNDLVNIVVGAVVSGAFGVGAVRHPWIFLAFLLVVWVCAPVIDHGFNAVTLSAGGSFLAWIIGAPAGYFSRRHERRKNARAIQQDRPPHDQARLGSDPIR